MKRHILRASRDNARDVHHTGIALKAASRSCDARRRIMRSVKSTVTTTVCDDTYLAYYVSGFIPTPCACILVHTWPPSSETREVG